MEESINLEQAISEIRRLRKLLDDNGIEWRQKEAAMQQPMANLTPEEKIVLFQSIFKGREDVFARRWFSRTSGKSGYQPVCRKEWNRDFCDKKKYKCADCPNREFEQLGYDYIYRHLAGTDPDGKDVIGLYAITGNNGCYFLCADFDDKNCEHSYQGDVKAYASVCRDWGIPAYIERSRSGNGAHVWIFFQEEVKARDVRSLGNAILTEAMEREGRMSFKSYDRFFPIRTLCLMAVLAILWLYHFKDRLAVLGTVFFLMMILIQLSSNGPIFKDSKKSQ